MTWKIEYNDELQIVMLTYAGEITGEAIKAAAAARIAMGEKMGVTKYLIDTMKTQVGSSATFDIYDVPSKIYPDKDVDRTSIIAVIKPELPMATKMVEFYEDACVNRGWLVRTFEDRDSAIKWLQEEFSPQSPADDSKTRADGAASGTPEE